MYSKNFYKKLRDQYLPIHLKAIFISESPPVQFKNYFYNPEGTSSELLFQGLTNVILGKKYTSKKEGLKDFSKAGYFLIDSIYTPINKLSDKMANDRIKKNYHYFIADIKMISKDSTNIPLILIKKNIGKVLEDRLIKNGFFVLNYQSTLPFPRHYYYNDFKKRLRRILKQI